MSSVWSWWVIIGTVVSMLACVWLIVWTNRQRASKEEIAESESHVWDEDVRELNNPLPMWWLWLFILTIIWSVGYLIYYPGLGSYAGSSDSLNVAGLSSISSSRPPSASARRRASGNPRPWAARWSAGRSKIVVARCSSPVGPHPVIVA